MTRWLNFGFVICGAVLLASASGAATLRVERDGTGDYTTIQPALDMAAAGDTVLIGPGEFTELTNQYLPGNGGWVDVAGYVKAPDITIIGSGSQVTLVGPASYTPGYIVNSFAYIIGGNLEIRDLTVRNCSHGLHIDSGVLSIFNCSFENNEDGIMWYSVELGGGVWNSQFSSSILYSHGIFILGTGRDFVVEECTFENSPIEIQNVQGLTVRDCNFFAGGSAITVNSGGTAYLEGCQIHDMTGVGVILRPSNVSVTLIECEVSAGMDAVVSNGVDNSLTVNNSVLTGGSRSAVTLQGMGPASIHHCELHKGSSDYSVVCNQAVSLGGVRHDFRGNYWGTVDPSQIEAWILDGHDDPAIRAEVLYTPFATGSTDLVVTMTPVDSQVVIPEAGGTFQYGAYLVNNTADDIVADLVLEAVLPDLTVYPVATYPAQTIPAASAFTKLNLLQSVPGGAPSGTYSYRLTASLGDTVLVDSAEFPFEKQGAVAAAVSDGAWTLRGWNRDGDIPPVNVASGLILHPATPNPFNPTTTLAFELPTTEAVTLRVYDLQGRLVRSLLRGEVLSPGRNEAVWDGRNDSGRRVSSGTYFWRVEAGQFSEIGRMVMVK